jgi:hypothetical protein
MEQGGYSGKRPFEIAADNGFDDVVDYIVTSRRHQLNIELRGLVNRSNGNMPQSHIKATRMLIDTFWRAKTLHWVIQPNRHTMGQCLNPHPDIISSVYNGAYSGGAKISNVESLFADLVARHNRYLEEFQKLL